MDAELQQIQMIDEMMIIVVCACMCAPQMAAGAAAPEVRPGWCGSSAPPRCCLTCWWFRSWRKQGSSCSNGWCRHRLCLSRALRRARLAARWCSRRSRRTRRPGRACRDWAARWPLSAPTWTADPARPAWGTISWRCTAVCRCSQSHHVDQQAAAAVVCRRVRLSRM